MLVESVDVLKESLEDWLGAGNGLMQQERSAKINAGLDQVISTEVVLSVGAFIVSTKTRLQGIDAGVTL